MSRHATGRPAGFAGRSGPPTTSGALDGVVLRVMAARRQHRLAMQSLEGLEHLAQCYGAACPSVELLLRIERARQEVKTTEAKLHRAVVLAQKTMPTRA